MKANNNAILFTAYLVIFLWWIICILKTLLETNYKIHFSKYYYH